MSKFQKDFLIKRKQRLIYVMGDKCACCGYSKCDSALEFHHINPQNKSFTISSNLRRNWEELRKELQKTIMVCSNCHREIHAGMINNDELVSSYIDERAEEISQLTEELKTHKVYYCKNCGAIVSTGNEYCLQCAHKMRRKVERPTREILKEQIRTIPFVKIAQIYGVTDNAVRKWCIKYNLPSKVKDIKKYSNEEWELL